MRKLWAELRKLRKRQPRLSLLDQGYSLGRGLAYFCSRPRFVGTLPQPGFMEYLEQREMELRALPVERFSRDRTPYPPTLSSAPEEWEGFPDWVVRELNLAYAAGRRGW